MVLKKKCFKLRNYEEGLLRVKLEEIWSTIIPFFKRVYPLSLVISVSKSVVRYGKNRSYYEAVP